MRQAVRRVAVAGVTVLAVALVAGGVAAVRGDRGAPARPAPQGPPPSVTTSPADAEYQDLPVWWSPDLDEELDLPLLRDSPLPRDIDLTAEVPALADQPIERAVAAFAGPDLRDPASVVLVAPGEEVKVRQKSREMVSVLAAMDQASRGAPLAWLAVDRDTFSGRMLERPSRPNIPIAAQEQLVVELYSK